MIARDRESMSEFVLVEKAVMEDIKKRLADKIARCPVCLCAPDKDRWMVAACGHTLCVLCAAKNKARAVGRQRETCPICRKQAVFERLFMD